MTLIQKLLLRVFGIKPKPTVPLTPSGVIRGESPELDYHGMPYQPTRSI